MSRHQSRVIPLSRRLDLMLRLALLLIACGLSIACGGGGGGEGAQERVERNEAVEIAPQDEWDVMDWDDGEWALVLPATRVPAFV